jgi:ATPase subunit of ABC transporter with duplicated ATPase domains
MRTTSGLSPRGMVSPHVTEIPSYVLGALRLMTAVIVCSDLNFSWPDGTCVLSGLTLSIGAGRTGLIGVNGSGKSTLLRLIAGELRPAAGAVRTSTDVGYLPQAINLGTRRTVSDLLGITAARNALHAIEAGDAFAGEAMGDTCAGGAARDVFAAGGAARDVFAAGDAVPDADADADADAADATAPDAFAAVGNDWDVEERARAWLDRLGLAGLGLDDRVERLSGGETIGVALAALFLRRPGVLLLDEPTNNLDLNARRRLYDAVAAWSGVMVIVSHDRELLGLVDRIADLSGGEVRMYGGNLDAYSELMAVEHEAARRAVTSAGAEVRRERRDLIDAQIRQATRDRQGRKVAASRSLPKVVTDARKKHAQESAGRSRELHTERLATARARLEEAKQAARDDAEIRVELPATAVPAGRTVLTVTGLAGARWHPAARPQPVASKVPLPGVLAELIVRGPERIALTGPNGAGKTTLLRAIADAATLPGVSIRRGAVVGYLPQRLDILDDSLTVVDNVRAAAPAALVNEVRANLARFLFRGGRADRRAGSLSGGERFRAVLAALLLAQPAPQLLLLDEPTNNLDLASVRQLSQALESYRGAIVVASHDVPFLRSAGVTRWLGLDREVGLTVIDPL